MASAAASLPFNGHLPERVAVDAYGNGGFRFAGMSHRGSLLSLGDGMHGWTIASPDEITTEAIAPLLERLRPPQFLLLGTGRAQVFPSADVRRAFAMKLVGLEVMDTGAAARTYNVLLAERRPVCAALIAVE